jgi:hypothetical protein
VKKMLTALVLLLLGGCGLVRQAEMAKAKDQLTAARAECRAAHPDSLAAMSSCWTEVENAIWRPYVRYGDLQTLMQAQRQVLAVKVDHGELTKEDANLQLAQVVSALRKEELQRNNATDQTAAQQSAASAQMLGAAAALLEATRPAPAVNTSCNRIGTVVNCTSY